ncbi:hypothetical protein C0J52_15298 [Blattella germanica]|nr:hypothetical protein C0J52_15298 [Blattella germanica]
MSFRKNRIRESLKSEESKDWKRDRRGEPISSGTRFEDSFGSAETIVEFLSSDEDISDMAPMPKAKDTALENERVDFCTVSDLEKVRQTSSLQNKCMSIQQSVKCEIVDNESGNVTLVLMNKQTALENERVVDCTFSDLANVLETSVAENECIQQSVESEIVNNESGNVTLVLVDKRTALENERNVTLVSVDRQAALEIERLDDCTCLNLANFLETSVVENECIQQSEESEMANTESVTEKEPEDAFCVPVQDNLMGRLSLQEEVEVTGEKIEVTSREVEALNEERDVVTFSIQPEKIISLSQYIQEEESKNEAYLLKLLILGNRGSGKSAFLRRYIDGCFDEHYEATTGVDFVRKELLWDDVYIPLLLCDVSGEELEWPLKYSTFDMAKGVFLMHDATCMDSLAEAMERCKTDLSDVQKNPLEVPAVLLINKCDAGDVNCPLLDDLCDRYNFVTWYKISVKDNLFIEDVVFSLVSKVVARWTMC